MIFYRLACYEKSRVNLITACTELTMHPSEAEGRKRLAAHKRHLKKAKAEGTGRLEKLTVDVEFLTKRDWMKLVLGDSPGGFADDDDCLYICDLISELEVITEFEYEHKPEEKET